MPPPPKSPPLPGVDVVPPLPVVPPVDGAAGLVGVQLAAISPVRATPNRMAEWHGETLFARMELR